MSDVWMERPNLKGLPVVNCPAGYRIRTYRRGDAAAWTDIQREADRLNVFSDRTFADQFPGDELTRQERIFFVEDPAGLPVGTVAAWYLDAPSDPCGVIHWLAVLPAQQRKGLGRALMAHALTVMATMHQRAVLSTDSARPEALALYRSFGFAPR